VLQFRTSRIQELGITTDLERRKWSDCRIARTPEAIRKRAFG